MRDWDYPPSQEEERNSNMSATGRIRFEVHLVVRRPEVCLSNRNYPQVRILPQLLLPVPDCQSCESQRRDCEVMRQGSAEEVVYLPAIRELRRRRRRHCCMGENFVPARWLCLSLSLCLYVSALSEIKRDIFPLFLSFSHEERNRARRKRGNRTAVLPKTIHRYK